MNGIPFPILALLAISTLARVPVTVFYRSSRMTDAAAGDLDSCFIVGGLTWNMLENHRLSLGRGGAPYRH